ncbi:hypothetical protein K2173_019927 [Erythroxylum novogranatense]|uniref:BAHD acyltransferase n=1 Tax=Erythroxylum novogranatense TaxID=1862640 RepID=A0AAV8U9F1_9ROSI|nr:hypothetical protein K2173_019927 [Erythroxylum novogranatense]
MDFKVQIISKENIKPSSPTQDHLRTYQLSLLDQIAPNTHVPIILFYSGNFHRKMSYNLKTSLAETLTHFPPFAGKAKDRFYVDCNDDGATYIEASVDVDITSLILHLQNVEQLMKLMPCGPYDDLREPNVQQLLAVQVNYFRCGGMAICASLHHLVADASSLSIFLHRWAAVARGSAVVKDAIFGACISLFPPVPVLDFSYISYENEYTRNQIIVRKRFIVEEAKMAALRDRVGDGPHLKRPTRYEAVAALMWGAAIAASRQTDPNVKEHSAAGVVDLRRKMDKTSSKEYVGNLWKWTLANCSTEGEPNYNELAAKIRECTRKVDNEWADVDGYLDFSKKAVDVIGKRSSARIFYTSWCKFPFYEVDFGWGKPTWVGTGKTPSTGAYFLETSDGKGMEAWLGLAEEDMVLFERHPDILKYASFSKNLAATNLLQPTYLHPATNLLQPTYLHPPNFGSDGNFRLGEPARVVYGGGVEILGLTGGGVRVDSEGESDGDLELEEGE